MSSQTNAPRTAHDLVDDRATFNREVLTAVRAFARSKPWRGTIDERVAKYRALHAEFCRIYGLKTELRLVNIRDGRQRSDGGYSRRSDVLVLMHKLSVVTYLHAVAYAIGEETPLAAFRWSINLFKRCFPISFSRCRAEGFWLVRD